MVVFLAIVAAYELGQRRSASRVQKLYRHKLKAPHATEVLLEYRNATGFRTRRKIRIIGYQPRPYGRSYIFAMSNSGPRLFRVDRVLSIASSTGTSLDLQIFLAENFGGIARL